ncbi:hypothetical protein [Demequina sp.]|uniref:hypothetical protein n=1 Tax=Demequina sp. TaxID=2050685 RepID=UPI003A8BAA82
MTLATDLDSRKYFRTLDAALADLGLPLGLVDKIRAAVTGLDYEHVSIPGSRDHIALELPGVAKPVAYITPMFVALHPLGGEPSFVEIAEPETVAAAAPDAGALTFAEPVAAVRHDADEPRPCPTCYMGLPLSGICDWCG